MSTSPEYHVRIKELPTSERPRERLLKEGASSLSGSELLAILLRTGSEDENAVHLAERLLRDHGGLAGLAKVDAEALRSVKGLGDAKIAQLKAALELARRLAAESFRELSQVRSPADAADMLLSEMRFLEQEEVWVMLLDMKNRVQDTKRVYKGSLNASSIRVGELFRDALRRSSASVIVAHNHPSGDPTPSPEDVAVTREIVEAGKLLDVEVLDHLIIGGQSWVSLKERGLGFG